MELGQTSDSSNGPLSTADEGKDKVSYPSYSLRGDKMEEFLKECPEAKEVGYELTARVKLKVSGFRDDQYGKDLTLDVQSMDDFKDEDEDEDENEETPAEEASETPEEEATEQAEGSEPDEEEKMLGYKRPQRENKPAPGASAKDLEE